ncbi:MAG: hypothetical protein QXU18_12260 [Thermoplasmatales archaeon]
MFRISYSGFNEKLKTGLANISKLLSEGDFIESPFDMPTEESRGWDQDKYDDDRNFARQKLCISVEKIVDHGIRDISTVPFQPRLYYFLDGSLKTKYLGEYIEGDFSFPVIMSQTLCAVVKKDDTKLLKKAAEQKISIMFPSVDSGLIPNHLYTDLLELNKKWEKDKEPIRIEFLKKDEVRDIRYSMLGKTRSLMHDLEVSTALSLKRDKWLVIDGDLQKYNIGTITDVIGLAKSFSREPTFDLGKGGPQSITRYLVQLGVGQRTSVFSSNTPDIAFWYIRLRNYPPMEPLGGIVKVEMNIKNYKMKGEEYLNSEGINLVDELSAEIFSLRLPSLYPHPRWPSFIYPIRVCELIMRSMYINNDVMGYLGHLIKVGD